MKTISDKEFGDLYHTAYNIMVLALSAPNMIEGLEKSFFLTKLFLEADDVVLFKKNDDGIYVHVLNQPFMIGDSHFLSMVLNGYAKQVEESQFKYFGTHSNLKTKSVEGTTFLSIPVQNASYVLAITNLELSLEDPITPMLVSTYSIILNQFEQFERMKIDSNKDPLTGLDSRKPYHERLDEIDSNGDEYYYMLFDLFRLKFINDRYSHAMGDSYIIKTAEILNDYFPKSCTKEDENGKVYKESIGGCVYRIGGDEFAVIATRDAYSDIFKRARGAIEDVSHMKLDTMDPILLGLNFGYAYRNHGQSSSELYIEADKHLALDKSKMYRKYHIKRRK